jgi:hypothetical protein
MKKYSQLLSMGLLTSLFCFGSYLPLSAQSIDRQVISTTGENFQTANGSLVMTMGEIAVETFKSDIQLSQGFHQEWAIITSVTPASEELSDVKVYPNPTIGILHVESESEVQIFLFDLSGKLKISTSQPSGVGQIDLSDFAAGIYVLEVSDLTGKKKVLKIEKVE